MFIDMYVNYVPKKYESVSFREFLRNIGKKRGLQKSMRLLRIVKPSSKREPTYKYEEVLFR